MRRETESVIENTLSALQTCFTDPKCVVPTLTIEQKAWATKSPYIQGILSDLYNEDYAFDKRKKWLGYAIKNVAAATRRP